MLDYRKGNNGSFCDHKATVNYKVILILTYDLFCMELHSVLGLPPLFHSLPYQKGLSSEFVSLGTLLVAR